jgi:hypothetical protein
MTILPFMSLPNIQKGSFYFERLQEKSVRNVWERKSRSPLSLKKFFFWDRDGSERINRRIFAFHRKFSSPLNVLGNLKFFISFHVFFWSAIYHLN